MQDESVKIPHIGWNLLEGDSSLLKGMKEEPYVYFVHSYYASNYDESNVEGISSYGNLKILGLVRKGNVIGAQFHPEKSGEVGLTILKNFKEMVE